MLREGKSTAGDFRIPSGCAVSSVFSRSGKRLDGSDIIRSIEIMHDRSNGLGGGFAGYGIYPEYAEQYAFHVFYNNVKAKEECEKFINEHFDVVNLSKIPIRKIPQITDEPLIWRYFVTPLHTKLAESQLDEDEFTARCVNRVNTFIDGAYIFSSGKNMGVFKAVGYPEDVGRFYRLDEYAGYCWTAHGRYPTNTPGWWGGAHPFALLDLSVVHNGEISSYDANRRCIEMYGYNCNLLTDTEVITYIFDYLVRRQGLTLPRGRKRHRGTVLDDHSEQRPGGARASDVFAQCVFRPARHRSVLHSGRLYGWPYGTQRPLKAAFYGRRRKGRYGLHRQ